MNLASSWCVVFQPTSIPKSVLNHGCVNHLKPVPPIPNSIVVNAGDFLRRCEAFFDCSATLHLLDHHCDDVWIVGSNDTIRSTVHRVVAPSGLVTKDHMVPARYSIPYVSFFPFFIYLPPAVSEQIYSHTISPVLWPRMSFHFSAVPMSVHGWSSWYPKDPTLIIDCIPGTWSADQPKRYEPVSVSCLVNLGRGGGALRSAVGAGEGVYDEAVCRKLLSEWDLGTNSFRVHPFIHFGKMGGTMQLARCLAHGYAPKAGRSNQPAISIVISVNSYRFSLITKLFWKTWTQWAICNMDFKKVKAGLYMLPCTSGSWSVDDTT